MSTPIVRRRKKAIEVDTIQWLGDNEADVQAFAGGAAFFFALNDEDREGCDDPEATAAVFDCLHSTWILVYTGQHIVRGVKRELYPIAEDVLDETYDVAPAAGRLSGTVREQLVHQLQCEGAFTEQAAVELADEVRREGILKAVGRLRAIPVNCTALTGPVWYGTGWKECITALEDIADYQKPDDEAYPGELQRLRALYLQLRVAALRKEDLPEAQRLLLVQVEHEAKEREKSTAPSGDATPDFFQPGHTYTREHHGDRIEFRVTAVDTSPDGEQRLARGWRTYEFSDWESTDSDDLTGWTDVTEAGEDR